MSLRKLLLEERLKRLEERLENLSDELLIDEALKVISENWERFEGRDKLDALMLSKYGKQVEGVLRDDFLSLLSHLLRKISPLSVPPQILEVEELIRKKTKFKSAEDFWRIYTSKLEKLKEEKLDLYRRLKYSMGKEPGLEDVMKMAFEQEVLLPSNVKEKIPGATMNFAYQCLSALYLIGFLKKEGRGRYRLNERFDLEVAPRKMEIEEVKEISSLIKDKMKLDPDEFWRIYDEKAKALPQAFRYGLRSPQALSILKLFLEEGRASLSEVKQRIKGSPSTTRKKVESFYKMGLLKRISFGVYALNEEFGKA